MSNAFSPLVGNAWMWGAGVIYTYVSHCAGGGISNPFVAQGQLYSDPLAIV